MNKLSNWFYAWLQAMLAVAVVYYGLALFNIVMPGWVALIYYLVVFAASMYHLHKTDKPGRGNNDMFPGL
jgi:hypothetical protein